MEAATLTQLIRTGRYERSWWGPDVVAGLTVAAMLVPQAMAYAELGGLPPSSGFRAALVALPVYAFLGTSRHLGIGPEPGTAVLSATAAMTLAGGDPDRFVALMAALAGLVGVISLVAGALRLGFVADLLSKPVLVGYITGVGLTLLTSQYSSFTGIEISSDQPVGRTVDLVSGITDIDASTLGIGVATLVIILVLRRSVPTAPGALIGLTVSMIAAAAFDLEVALVGEIEAAFPSFAVPAVEWSDVIDLVPSAAGVALIAYSDNILTARSIASKHDYTIDPDRELVALGAMNALGAFGGGFPVSSSASRSFVPSSIGSRSQVSSLVTVTAVALFLLIGRSVLAEIPRAGLAAVIIAAAFAVIDLEGFSRLVSISRSEAGLAFLTCLAVLTTDLLTGVLAAVALSVVITVARVARPNDAILGAGEGLDGWIPIDDDRAKSISGLLVYRFDAPLFFANGEYFRVRVRQALEANPGAEIALVLDMEGIGSIDTTAIDHLTDLFDEMDQREIAVGIARANTTVVGVLERAQLLDRLGPGRVFPTINSAVRAFEEGLLGGAASTG
jgi:high affinity sulfate transporter 1